MAVHRRRKDRIQTARADAKISRDQHRHIRQSRTRHSALRRHRCALHRHRISQTCLCKARTDPGCSTALPRRGRRSAARTAERAGRQDYHPHRQDGQRLRQKYSFRLHAFPRHGPRIQRREFQHDNKPAQEHAHRDSRRIRLQHRVFQQRRLPACDQ